MATRLKVGDLVWAKMKGFPAWPGKIIAPKDDTKRSKKDKSHHYIFFYGSENYAWVPFETVYSYIGNKEKFLMTARQPKAGYKEAIEAIEDAVKAMPEEERLHAEALPSIDEELAEIFKKRPASFDGTQLQNSVPVKKARKDLEERLSAPEPVIAEKGRKSEGDVIRRSAGGTPDSVKSKKKKRPRESEGGEGGEGSPKKTPKLMKEKSDKSASIKKSVTPKTPRDKTEKESSQTKGGEGGSPRKTPKLVKDKSDKESSTKKSVTPRTPRDKTDKDSSVKKKPLKAVKALTTSQKIIKKAKAVAKATVQPNISTQTPGRAISAVSPTKIKPRKIPDLRVSESEFSPISRDLGAPGAPISTGSGTQIGDAVMIKPAIKSVIPTPMRIGFLGLGIMGQGMVMNLLRSGHEVTVWNRTTLKCREFVKAGALKGNSPCEVVQACDITFCCVADTTAVKDIVFGTHGVLKGITNGKCYVEMSTIDEDTIQDIAEAISARGGVYLEAPVVGSRVPALEGQLTILASGDRKLFDDCFSCFEAIGKKSLYLGSDPGAATRMKLIVNMVMGSVVASLAEAMAMAEKVGLDQEDVAEVLTLGSLNCPTIAHKSQAILNQKYDPHFPLQHQQKDLRLALQLGDKVEQPLYLAAAANELYKKARRLGYGDSDISAVFRAASN